MSNDAKTISLRHWLDYIEKIHAKNVDFDLSRPAQVAKNGKFTEFSIPVITVAGTNGKGSTSTLISKLLSACGMRVGCYLSPHLQFFNERIIVHGKPVQEHLICDAFAKVEKARAGTTLTYFEFTTLAAFHIFQNASLDALILEVGVGGEKDAVNLVDPDLSIITNISFDHMHWLGEELGQIAKAKAGIMRPNKPTILGLKAQLPEMLECAKQTQAKLYCEGQAFGWHDKYKSYWQFNGCYIKVPQTFVPSTSISLGLAAVEVLKSILPKRQQIPFSRLSHILRKSQLPGRFQRIAGRVETVLDVAHNPAGAAWLAQNLNKLQPVEQTVAVWSSCSDKDLSGLVTPMLSQVSTWVVAPLEHERGASVEQLTKTLKAQGVEDNTIIQCDSIAGAFKHAESICCEDGRVVVFGSLMTVSEVFRTNEQNYQTFNTFFSSDPAEYVNEP